MKDPKYKIGDVVYKFCKLSDADDCWIEKIRIDEIRIRQDKIYYCQYYSKDNDCSKPSALYDEPESNLFTKEQFEKEYFSFKKKQGERKLKKLYDKKLN